MYVHTILIFERQLIPHTLLVLSVRWHKDSSAVTVDREYGLLNMYLQIRYHVLLKVLQTGPTNRLIREGCVRLLCLVIAI